MAVSLKNVLGARVRKLRDAAGLSQQQCADSCQRLGWDLSRGTFAKLEAGLRHVNDGEVLILSRVLKCSLEDLYGGISLNMALSVARHGDS